MQDHSQKNRDYADSGMYQYYRNYYHYLKNQQYSCSTHCFQKHTHRLERSILGLLYHRHHYLPNMKKLSRVKSMPPKQSSSPHHFPTHHLTLSHHTYTIRFKIHKRAQNTMKHAVIPPPTTKLIQTSQSHSWEQQEQEADQTRNELQPPQPFGYSVNLNEFMP